MHPQNLVLYIIFQLLVYLALSHCLLRVEDDTGPELDRSGWRTVNSPFGNLNEQEINSSNRSKKLVEWDDDDLLNGLDTSKSRDVELSQNKSLFSFNLKPATKQQSRRLSQGKFSRLVYHGRVKANESEKLVDGIKLHINIHKPVTISRRSSSNHRQSLFFAPEAAQEEPTGSISRWTDTKPKVDPQSIVRPSSSDWKPIVLIPRSRRASKKQKDHANHEKVEAQMQKSSASASTSATLDFKWKPITTTRHKIDPPVNIEDTKQTKSVDVRQQVLVEGKEAVVYGKKMDDSLLRSTGRSTKSFEDPFDDENGVALANKQEERKLKETKPTSKSNNNRWTPVDTTTPSVESYLDRLTTISPPTSPNATLGGPESAQKSASDLNYIYSSQPIGSQSDFLTSGRQSANGYYSNYVIQPQQAQQQQQQQQQVVIGEPIPGPIIDTTSGQTPEMILDRGQEQVGDYSIPQSNSGFQPAQPLPTRITSQFAVEQPASSYYAARQQPTRQTPNNQVLRQEHHYHYYNNQQSTADRQQVSYQQPQQNVIREIQPLLISQPIIQQQPPSTTTTPAPQIIREIIKEVPAQASYQQIQPVQVSRIILPQPISIPVPNQRELEPESMGYAYAPTAQRLIRQISGNIPAVRIPQIRIPLPIPSIQLPPPVRLGPTNQAPVTRQTGSFVIPPMPKKTTTYLTETQAMPTHTTIMHTTQFTPATRTTVYTTDHQT